MTRPGIYLALGSTLDVLDNDKKILQISNGQSKFKSTQFGFKKCLIINNSATNQNKLLNTAQLDGIIFYLAKKHAFISFKLLLNNFPSYKNYLRLIFLFIYLYLSSTSSVGTMGPDWLSEALISDSHSLRGVENSGMPVILKLRTFFGHKMLFFLSKFKHF